jgi:hypothetical protein
MDLASTTDTRLSYHAKERLARHIERRAVGDGMEIVNHITYRTEGPHPTRPGHVKVELAYTLEVRDTATGAIHEIADADEYAAIIAGRA